MKLGFFSAAFPGWSLEEVAAWAAENEFDTLEIACWPVGKATRRYAGVTTIDVTDFDVAKANEVHAIMDNYGLSISSLGYYPNPLDPDPAMREEVVGHLKKVILAAELLEVDIVGTLNSEYSACGNDDDWRTTLAAMAGTFVLLEAHFLAAIQIIVYAGAIMVLFMFVVMLLGNEEAPRGEPLVGQRPLAVHNHGGHLADQQSHGEARHRHIRRPHQSLAQRFAEVTIGDRVRRGQIERA